MLHSFFRVRVLDIVPEVVLGACEVGLRRGEPGPVSIICISLRRSLRIEEVLSGGISFHLTLFEDFSVGRRLLLYEFERVTDSLIIRICLPKLRHDVDEVFLLNGVASRGLLELFEDRVRYVLVELQVAFVLFFVAKLREDRPLWLEKVLLDSLFLLYVGVNLHFCFRALLKLFTLGCLELGRHLLEFGLDDAIFHLVIVATRWNTGHFIVSSGILFHLELRIVLHIVLAKHGITACPRRDLLHPVLLISLNVPIVVDLTVGWKDRELRAIDDIGYARLPILAVLLLHGLVVFHFLLEVAEVLPDLLLGENLLLRFGLLDPLSKDRAGSIAFFQSVFDLADKVMLLLLHLSDLVREGRRLSLVVVHVGLKVVMRASPFVIQLLFLLFDALFVQLELAFLFAHLMSQLLKHSNLLPRLLVHHCCLRAHL